MVIWYNFYICAYYSDCFIHVKDNKEPQIMSMVFYMYLSCLILQALLLKRSFIIILVSIVLCMYFALIVGHVAWDSWWRLGISTLLGISLVFRSERSTTYPSGPPKSPQSERFSKHSKHSKRTRRSSPAKLRTQNLNLVRQTVSMGTRYKKNAIIVTIFCCLVKTSYKWIYRVLKELFVKKCVFIIFLILYSLSVLCRWTIQ